MLCRELLFGDNPCLTVAEFLFSKVAAMPDTSAILSVTIKNGA
jgi:hypothetical protein